MSGLYIDYNWMEIKADSKVPPEVDYLVPKYIFSIARNIFPWFGYFLCSSSYIAVIPLTPERVSGEMLPPLPSPLRGT